jgi:DNA-binding GntR family transcriptional regulator
MSNAAGMDLTASYYNELRDDILSGDFPTGTHLLETDLAARYGVSRTPIREALALLEHDKLIERAVRGYKVREGTPQDVLEAYEARIALESAAASGAAQRRTDFDLALLAQLQERSEAADTPEEWRRLQFLWHEAIWAAGHNSMIVANLQRITGQLRVYDQGKPPPSCDYALSNAVHASICAAVRARDSTLARQLMEEHLCESRDERLQNLSQ